MGMPPDVMILRTSAGNAVIRSERLDTLLVEYYRFQHLHSIWSEDLSRDVTASIVLRWMSEFFIGYRHPELALLAQRLRPKLPGMRIKSLPRRKPRLGSGVG